MFTCSLCQEETCYVSTFCPDCIRFKRLVNIYGKIETLAILERVCLRNQKQRGYKIDDVKKNLSESLYTDASEENGIGKTTVGKNTRINREAKQTAS